MSNIKKIVASITILALIIILIVDNSLIWNNFDYNLTILNSDNFHLIPFNKNNNNEPDSTAKLLFDHCELRNVNPWDPTIEKWINFWPIPDPTRNCTVKLEPISKLIDGKLYINCGEKCENSENNENNVNATFCQWRCLKPNGDYRIEFGEWMEPFDGIRPRCDVIEVQCNNYNETSGEMEIFYEFLHAQIYRPDFPQVEETSTTADVPIMPPLDKPDVHIILFDSVASTQFIRSMPKTLHVLREYYEAIAFRHLNKVGINSRPNGFALLLGKTIYPIPNSPVSRGHKADYNSSIQWCREFLDNDQFIGYRFQDDGYKTMMSEDWQKGVFNWPNCFGFEKAPTTHYMKPFQVRLEGNKGWRSTYMNRVMTKDSCKEKHYYQIEYLKNFLDAYPDQPKFSLTWMTELSHNSRNNLYHTDDYFSDFFNKYQEKLNNSFVLVMGDHGNRLGSLRSTEVGEIEDKNPLLFMSIPARMRRDPKIINILKQNAHELISHYDLYATMVEITKPSSPRHPNPLLKGSSLFHPLPQPRTCDRLGIPFHFCMCDFKKHPIPKKNEIGLAAVNLMIEKMNENLGEFNETSPCSLLTLNPEANLEVNEYEEKMENIKVFQINWETLPGRGQFSGFITQNGSQNGSFVILSERFPRANPYAAQAYCAAGAKYESYCFCKNLIKSSTAIPPTTILATTKKSLFSTTKSLKISAMTTKIIPTTLKKEISSTPSPSKLTKTLSSLASNNSKTEEES